MILHRLCIPLAIVLTVSACGNWYGSKEKKIPGERISIRETLTRTNDTATTPSTALATAVTLPAPVVNTTWNQRNMSATHKGKHLALSSTPQQIWREDVGRVVSKKSIATTPPVVSADTVYFLNAKSKVIALSLNNGTQKWKADVTLTGEDSGDGFGGGLALSTDGRLFVSTGFGEVVALSAQTGDIQWRQRTTAPVRSAPTLHQGKVIVVARDNTAVAFDAATGKPAWDVVGATTNAAFLGGASPAAAGQIVVLPFASGEIVAVDAATGRRGWAQVLSGGKRGAAMSTINDISSDPVLHAGNVYVANQSGQLSAFDAGTGRTVWTRSAGAYNAGWITGDSLYIVTSDARLLRILTKTGQSVWETTLPLYANERDKEDVITYGGPIVANNNIYLTSSESGLVVYNATSGQAIESDLIDKKSSIAPVIAQQTLLVVTDSGNLHAFK